LLLIIKVRNQVPNFLTFSTDDFTGNRAKLIIAQHQCDRRFWLVIKSTLARSRLRETLGDFQAFAESITVKLARL
jgi:hypothetical protein